MNSNHSWLGKIFQSHSDRKKIAANFGWGFLKKLVGATSQAAWESTDPMEHMDLRWTFGDESIMPQLLHPSPGRFLSRSILAINTPNRHPRRFFLLRSCVWSVCFWGAFYTEAQVVYDGCLGFEKWWKNRWKRKGGGTRIKPVGIGLMDWIFRVIFLKCPSLTTEVSLFVYGLPGVHLAAKGLLHYISFAWSYISETFCTQDSDKNETRGSCICQNHGWIS